jgi:hexosaminidase
MPDSEVSVMTSGGGCELPLTAVRVTALRARCAGIRVVPELDTPGHAYSWGLAYPNLTVSCPSAVACNSNSCLGAVDVVPLDPTRNDTYAAVSAVLQQLVTLFPDQFMHLGGDEVQYECWANSSVCALRPAP